MVVPKTKVFALDTDQPVEGFFMLRFIGERRRLQSSEIFFRNDRITSAEKVILHLQFWRCGSSILVV